MKEKVKKDLIFKDQILRILQMPQNIFSEISPINFLSSNEVLIQDSQGILEYGNKNIKVKVGRNLVASFKGRNLKIKSLSQRNLIITGFIKSMEYIF